MHTSNIKNIRDYGQSIWLDFFDRKIMHSGELKRLIDEDGISGVTSNPSIFEKPISGSSDYDEDIRAFSAQKKNNDDIFFELAVKDIRRAAAFFKTTHENTSGEDGFVSLEVSPHLAYDAEATVNQARELWKSVACKNVMIKIPSTAEGLAAIRKCTSEGINVNITLLFGLPRYRQVADAYLSGLEDRLNANLPIHNIVSVASFFLSRIDVLIDPLLQEKKLLSLRGEVAIASAKKAYEIYKYIFSSDRFNKLQTKGARKQRVLWASTSTKDPGFSDVKYIEALIGPETINTVPLETLKAFNDHGKPGNRLENDMDRASGVLAQLIDTGIDINIITQKLEDEGIQKFNTAYDRLLKAIEEKQRAL